MTSKIKHIIEQLNGVVTFNVAKSMSDEDFIANIDAINLLCNLCDDLNIDRSEIRKKMDKLYPEFSLRVYGKNNIQLSLPLIKSLYRYIYDRGVDAKDRGPANRSNALLEMCCKVVKAYNENPLISSCDYLYALSCVTRTRDYAGQDDYSEIKNIVDGYLQNIELVSTEEKILRLKAYDDSVNLIGAGDWERWEEIRNSVLNIDVRQLDDEMFVIWAEVTRLSPLKELKKRATHSKRMQVEYLQGLTFTEFNREHRASVKRKLAKNLKTLNDDIINDIITLKIDSDMSVSTLHAIEIILSLRLELAQTDWEDKESVYTSLCRNRFELIAKVLKKKYGSTTSLNEKIEILERLVAISMMIDGNLFGFAIEEAENLKELPNLTYAQKLRLDWIPNINSENESKIVANMLPHATSSFEMETIGQISDVITADEREVVFNRYFELFDAALAAGNVSELGKFLVLAAYWNSDHIIRPRLTEAAAKVQAMDGLSLPERRVIAISAEIYSRIDALSRKFEDIA